VAEEMGKILQLLRDMPIRWSSTYFMIQRALLLEEVNFIVALLSDADRCLAN
jgi:hypothetical protein